MSAISGFLSRMKTAASRAMRPRATAKKSSKSKTKTNATRSSRSHSPSKSSKTRPIFKRHSEVFVIKDKSNTPRSIQSIENNSLGQYLYMIYPAFRKQEAFLESDLSASPNSNGGKKTKRRR